MPDIIALLELSGIRDRMVGYAGSKDGLSPGQRKILTVGVELASNCPILFLGAHRRDGEWLEIPVQPSVLSFTQTNRRRVLMPLMRRS